MTAPAPSFRAAGPADGEAIVDALLWAFNWSSERVPLGRDAVLAIPSIAHYVDRWPAPGDLGIVAEAPSGAIGATWLRYLPATEPGYGFVADDVPELSIGVHPEHRGRGVGRGLLRALLAAAGAAGVARVSLSVERGNRARALYLGEGFRVVGGGEDADTMLIENLDRLGVGLLDHRRLLDHGQVSDHGGLLDHRQVSDHHEGRGSAGC